MEKNLISRNDIKKVVINKISDAMEIPIDEIDTSKTWEQLDAYSIDVVHIVALLTRELNILVPRDDFEGLRTVDEFIDVFFKHQG